MGRFSKTAFDLKYRQNVFFRLEEQINWKDLFLI